MSSDAILNLVREIIAELSAAKGHEVIAVEGNHRLLDGSIGIDSLDLAALVVRLQQKTGQDPFAEGFIGFHTVDELVRLFSQPQP